MNLGPGFDQGQHPFVSSAALVARTMMQMWVRHGCMQPHEAPLSLACAQTMQGLPETGF